MTRSARNAAFMIAILLLVGCGGEGEVTGLDDGDGRGGGDTEDTRSIKASPSLSGDIWEIFVRKGCTSIGCHGGGAGGLTLDQKANAHANLVNVSGDMGQTLVIPGDADQSYMVKRVDGRVGPQMPLNRSPLDNIDLTNLKNWINQGAENN